MKITSSELLSQAIRNARVELDLSQQSTAELDGIKQATVSSFENHPDKCRIEMLFKLLTALDLELHLIQRGRPATNTGWEQEW